jgi:hypothetical protein
MTAKAPPMTTVEERDAFYEAIGVAITQWAHVEYALYLVFRACLNHAESPFASATFYAIENFRSKLQVADTITRMRLAKTPRLNEWTPLYVRLQQQSGVRNNLAHFTVLVHSNARPGRRYHLRPNIFNAANPWPNDWNPQGGYCVKQLENVLWGFGPLGRALENFAARVSGQPEPFPKSLEQEGRPHSTRSRGNQNRAKRSPPP